MIQPKIQEVWIPTRVIDTLSVDFLAYKRSAVIPTMVIAFTPEEFETFKREFGSKLLEKANKNSKLYIRYINTSNKFDIDKEYYDSYQGVDIKVDKESITSVLESFLLSLK